MCSQFLPALEQMYYHLRTSGVLVGVLNLDQEPKLAQRLEINQPAEFFLYRDGLVRVYPGAKAPQAIMAYLSAVIDASVVHVDTKVKKKDVLAREVVKVLGYFDDLESDEFLAFEAAAKQFVPELLFGYFTDAKLAKR